MRHKVAGWKLGRNTSHRRSLLRNLVTSLILEERIETTVPKAKALRPLVEKMITLGKRGDLAARRQALAYLMTSAAVDKLFDTIGPRFGDRQGGYLRIVRAGWRKGDGADTAFVELLGSEKLQEEKREKRAAVRSKRAEEAETRDGRSRGTAGCRASCRPRRRRRQGKGRKRVKLQSACKYGTGSWLVPFCLCLFPPVVHVLWSLSAVILSSPDLTLD